MKKFIAFLLATVICFSIVPYNALAVVITKTSEVNNVIDNISDDNIKSKIKGVLAEYPSGSSFSNSYNWASKINPKITTDSKVGSVKQCYGFALYVYASIFGLHGGGVKKDYTNDYESNKLLSGEHTASYQSFLNSGVKAGAHIRTTDNFSSVTDSNDGGHSMIVLHYDTNYLYVYHGNADGNGGVSVTQWTWDNFNKKQLGGRSTPRRIKYVAVPKLQYYHTCPSAGKNNQGEYGYETYKNGSTTAFGACKQCHKPYDWQGSFKKMNSTTYEIKSSSKNYVVKIRSLPYDGAPVLFDKVSKTFTVIGEVTNAYGNKWYAIDFQDDAKKQCYTAYVYGGQIDEHYNSTTTEVKAKEYKSANVVTHKHDYTYGNGKCYCGATKNVEPEKSSLKINLTSYPTSIKQGSAFGLRGTISSNYNIKKVKGYIKQGDTVYASSEDTPNKKKLDVKTAALNKSLVFGKLPVGNYSLCVEAVDTSGQTVRVNKNFSVYEEQKKDASTLSINLERYPVSINLGSSYSVRGNVSSNYTISKVRGYIYDSNGSVVQSTTDTPNSTYMEIRPANLNQKLIFGKLSSGNYTMKVEAVDASGKVVTATKNFTVKGGGNTPSGAPIKFEIETVPKGNMPYGKDFTLKGWFRSDSAIAETRAYILDENKNVVMQSDSASSTTSNYKIEGYKLDKGIKFDQLSPGGYYLKYYVRDADGDTSTWMSDKFYIVKESSSNTNSNNTNTNNSNSSKTISDGVYVIATKLNTNYVLDISGASKDNGANLQLWKNNGSSAQAFKVTHVGNGYYQIVNTNSGKAIDVQNGDTAAGTNVWQYQVNNTDAQLWKIVSAGGGSYYIIGKGSGLYLDVDNAYADSGTNVKIFDRNDAYDAQKWIFTKTSSSNSSSSTSGSSQTTTSSTSIKFEIESMPKGNLPYGKSFSLKGWFRSDSAIVEARAYMLDANKNVIMQSDKASSTTSNYKIQGYKLDKAMKFNELSLGGYYLKFFVRDANGDTFTWISDKFYIVK